MQIVTADQLLAQDLAKSGLETKDLDAHLAQESELAAVGIRPHLYMDTPGVGTPGYVIPYYDLSGNRAPFYRVRLFQPLPKGARYLQPQNSGSWLYFPKAFAELARAAAAGKGRTKINGFPSAIILTEGEKKAAKACAEGFPTCAVGGTYNWRTRTLILPEGTTLLKNRDGDIVAKLEKGANLAPTSDNKAFLASGLENLIRFVKDHDMQIIIAFDSDNPANSKVQEAAAELGFELRIQGLISRNIRQLILPASEGKKVGLDDFLQGHGADGLDLVLKQCIELKSAFPIHPNLKSLLNKRLGATLYRSEAKELALMVLSDMDRSGIRMMEQGTDTPFYFDSRSKKLLRVNLLQHHSQPLHESKFGEFMYKNYDIGQADSKFVQWLAASFTGEQPVESVQPRSTLALLDPFRLAYQLDDGHFAVVSADPEQSFVIKENGSDGLLFKADQVEPLDHALLAKEFKKQISWLQTKPKFEEFYWPKVLKQFKFARPNDYKVLSILSYMSPWLWRWNGAQLPVELLIGEPGSGKSSYYSLRLQILTGRPALRNQPTDVRDWYASITSSDGIHAIDNVHMVNKELRQRLSDEICRIVTEPSPYVEMRKLFTTSDNYRIPVRTVFAMTAIQQPFMNADILQRSLIFEMQAIGTDHDSDWASGALVALGGREAWLAHQLAVLHMLFRKAKDGGWNPRYKSQHRLAHLEQLFRLVGSIVGMADGELVGASLATASEEAVSEYDWTMEGLKSFSLEYYPELKSNPTKVFTLQDVASWAMSREEYSENNIITNARRLSRYVKSHKFMVEKVAGFILMPNRYGNRDGYRLGDVRRP